MKATIEHTDLFCGELNYCWVNRATIDVDGLSDRQVVQRLKKEIGLNGARARKVIECGDYAQYKLDGLHQAFIITYEY